MHSNSEDKLLDSSSKERGLTKDQEKDIDLEKLKTVEASCLVEGLTNDIFDTIFSFFKPSELQPFRLVRRSWNAYIPYIQLRNLNSELQWYVSYKLLSLRVAVAIDRLWSVKVEDRWALIPKSIREAIERLNMSKLDREFLVKDYPLLALMGRFISVDECNAMPRNADDQLADMYLQFPDIRPVSEHLKALVEDPWGVRILAKKLISPTQAANFKNYFVID